MGIVTDLNLPLRLTLLINHTTRFSARALLAMTLTIQLFVYPATYPAQARCRSVT